VTLREERDLSRGGFQNRDVGRSNYNFDLGPEYGPDFARFSDPHHMNLEDVKIRKIIFDKLESEDKLFDNEIEIIVENGFVILKGSVSEETIKYDIEQISQEVPGVVTVINALTYH
jgi:hypothetical protein